MAKTAGSTPRAGDGTSTSDIDELVTAVLTGSRVLVGVSARSLAAVEGRLTITQFRTLVVLDTNPGTNLNGLADELAVNSSTAMRMIDKLLAAGLVTRGENPNNRREVVLGLTDEGRRLVTTVTRRRRAEIARIVTKIPPEQRDALVDALHALTTAASEPELPAQNGPIAW